MTKTTMSVYAGISSGIPLSWKVGFLFALGVLSVVLFEFGFHSFEIITGLILLFLAVWGSMHIIAKLVFSGVDAVEEVSLCAGDTCSACKKGKLTIQSIGEPFTDNFLECSNCWKRY